MKKFITILFCLFATTAYAEKKTEKENENKYIRSYKTYHILTEKIEGVTYHIAVYNEKLQIITTLDGNCKGYQTVFINDLPKALSKDVKWKKKCFIHYYPDARVTTYPDKQVLELMEGKK